MTKEEALKLLAWKEQLRLIRLHVQDMSDSIEKLLKEAEDGVS